MKKTFVLLLTVCVVACMVLTLSACNTHSAKSKWTFDQTHHWHDCIALDCDEIYDKTEHTYGDWTSLNDDSHQKVCLCGVQITEEHAWGEGENTDDPSGTKIHTCTVCGYAEEYMPDHQVSQKGWIDSFDPSNLDNVTLTGHIRDEDSYVIPMIIKVSGTTSYEFMQFSETNTVDSFYVKNESTYTCYKKRSTWENWKIYTNYDFYYNSEFFLSLMPLFDKYMEFEYNPESKCYEAGEMVCESQKFGTLYYQSVVIQFEDGKITYILAKMNALFKTSPNGTDISEYMFNFSNYGKTEITLPEIGQ